MISRAVVGQTNPFPVTCTAASVGDVVENVPAVPFAMFYVALQRAPAAEVSAWFFLVPVVGVLMAWPLLGETPTAQIVVGMAGVSLGLWLVLAPGAAGRGRLVPSSPP